ncbi:hypothetical protein D3C71_1811900 [compost metagenome]
MTAARKKNGDVTKTPICSPRNEERASTSPSSLAAAEKLKATPRNSRNVQSMPVEIVLRSSTPLMTRTAKPTSIIHALSIPCSGCKTSIRMQLRTVITAMRSSRVRGPSRRSCSSSTSAEICLADVVLRNIMKRMASSTPLNIRNAGKA